MSYEKRINLKYYLFNIFFIGFVELKKSLIQIFKSSMNLEKKSIYIKNLNIKGVEGASTCSVS